MVATIRPLTDQTGDTRPAKRLVIVSNRGPIEHALTTTGIERRHAGGGVSTALTPVSEMTPVTWVAAALSDGDRLVAQENANIELKGDSEVRLVGLPDEAFDLFYQEFCNPLLWFLQHSLLDQIEDRLDPDAVWRAWEEGYLPANQAFAEATIKELLRSGARGDVMLQDYHLYAAPLLIRNVLPNAAMQHFIHIPWPGPDVWRRLPREIVGSICEGLLANDSVVFQTDASVQNFLLTIEAFCSDDARIDFIGGTITSRGRYTRVWANPISVDVESLLAARDGTEMQAYRSALAPETAEKTIVRVDRLDPSKNVLTGFQAYERMLTDHPEWIGHVNFIAHLVPSRGGIPEYDEYARETFNVINQVNTRFGTKDWTPIKVFFEQNRTQALASMCTYDVLLVNSVMDGMNLVSKEGPVLNERDGALVLSVTAGSYEELASGAIPVQPMSVVSTSEAMYFALGLPKEDRQERARRLRRAIYRHQIEDWLRLQLRDLGVIRDAQTILANGAWSDSD